MLHGRHDRKIRQGGGECRRLLEHDDFSSNRHRALSSCLSMILSENRYPLFRIMLQAIAAHPAKK
jgi:hypothetical protein